MDIAYIYIVVSYWRTLVGIRVTPSNALALGQSGASEKFNVDASYCSGITTVSPVRRRRSR